MALTTSPDSRELVTVIGPDAHFKGDMSFQGKARVMGILEGKITADGEIHIENGARCLATVDAKVITVDGEVDGNLTARDRLHLSAKAVVKGDIAAGSLVVTEGAVFVGHCSVGPDAVSSKRADLGTTRASLTTPAVETKPAIQPFRTPTPRKTGTDWVNESASTLNTAAAKTNDWIPQHAGAAKPAANSGWNNGVDPGA